MTAALWIMASKRGPACELHCLSYVLALSDKHVARRICRSIRPRRTRRAKRLPRWTTPRERSPISWITATDKAADDAGGAADAVRTADYSLIPIKPACYKWR